MRNFKKHRPDLTNPAPGGYWAGDLWVFQGKITRQRMPGASFLCNMFIVDEQGKVWLAVRRSVRTTAGQSAEWFAAPVVTGSKNYPRRAPQDWCKFVSASLVIPVLPA